MPCSSEKPLNYVRSQPALSALSTLSTPFLCRKAVFNQSMKAFCPLLLSELGTSVYTFCLAPWMLYPFPCQLRVEFGGSLNSSRSSLQENLHSQKELVNTSPYPHDLGHFPLLMTHSSLMGPIFLLPQHLCYSLGKRHSLSNSSHKFFFYRFIVFVPLILS